MNNAEKPSRGLAHAAAFTVALVMIVLKGLLFRPVWPLFVFCFCFFFVFFFFRGRGDVNSVVSCVAPLHLCICQLAKKNPKVNWRKQIFFFFLTQAVNIQAWNFD